MGESLRDSPSRLGETRPRVLLIGDASHAEFRHAAAALAAETEHDRAPDLAAAHRLAAEGLRPDVIILVQHRPSELDPADVEHLRRYVPLAPIIALQSSWCEGEGRVGRPLPGVVRVSWRQFAADILPGLIQWREIHGDGRLPDWAGPATLTPEERLLQQSGRALPPGQRSRHAPRPVIGHGTRSVPTALAGRGTVGIVSRSYEMRQLLSDACRAGGWHPVVVPASEHPPSIPCDVLLWDLDELPANAEAMLASGGVPLLLLLGFAREHDLERARAAGAAAIVGKPFSISGLLREIAAVRNRAAVAQSCRD